jgi:dihydrofolate synthase/folylpolyglutamate synthase
VVVDGAHNVDSVNKLGATLAEVFPGKRWTVIFGCYKDKDAEGMIKALAPRASRWIMTQARNTRALPVDQLMEIAQARGLRVVALPNLKDAVDAVAQSNDAVVVAGSLAVVGEARAAWGFGGSGPSLVDVDPPATP